MTEPVGLQAIKACGGLAIVQDTTEAEALDMPASALEHVDVDADVDRVLRVSDIGPALVELTAANVLPAGPAPREFRPSVAHWIDVENRMTGRDSDMEDLEQIGKLSSLTCPECAGASWEIGQKGAGHAWSGGDLRGSYTDARAERQPGDAAVLHRPRGWLSGARRPYG